MTINLSANKILSIVQLGLIVIIAVLLLWSQPWNDTTSSQETRKITVTGETVIEATPDEFTFYPYFEKKGMDKDALRDELTQDANQIVEEIRKLGVEDKDIQLDASSYDRWYWEKDQEGTLTVNLTVVATGDDLVQNIQDYLLTTDAEGQLSPQATFSKEKQQELDKLAIEQASNDAREKAEVQAALFGSELGDVLEVNQSTDSIFSNYRDIETSFSANSVEASLPVLPGQNDYTQSVVVTYELK